MLVFQEVSVYTCELVRQPTGLSTEGGDELEQASSFGRTTAGKPPQEEQTWVRREVEQYHCC